MKEALRSEGEITRLAGIEVSRVVPPLKNFQTLVLLGNVVYEMLMACLRREEGIVYSVSVRRVRHSNHTHGMVEASVDPAKRDEAEAMMEKVLNTVRCGDLAPDFFGEIKMSRMNFICMQDETVNTITDMAVNDVVQTGSIRTTVDDLRDLAAVTLEDVVALATREFAPEKLYWFTVLP